MFDPVAWLAAYPEFAGRVTTARAADLAAEAWLIFPIARFRLQDQQDRALGLAVAHLAQLSAPSVAGGPGVDQRVVGRVTDAGQGSVHVGFDAGPVRTLTEAFYQQTRYGQLLWMMLARFRLFRYVPGFPRVRPLFNSVP
jgi:Protein of unknown function (DUF4054)